jgi:L-amino acid N-acyltransferase YncA
LKSFIISLIKEKGFSEILLYSPETHKESWKFHDTLGFERVGEVIPPDDEVGMVWRKGL